MKPVLYILTLIFAASSTLSAAASSDPGQANDVLGSLSRQAAFSTLSSSYVGIPPCRVVDTRGNGFAGDYGPPLLSVGIPRTFVMPGQCGIPSGAQAVVVNFAVVSPAAEGYLTAYPSGGSVPLVSSVNFSAGHVTTNGAIVPLGASGAITVFTGGAGANTNLVIDVNGYFASTPAGQKLCSVINGEFRDTIPVPASWVASNCAAHRDLIAGAGGAFYQLACIFESGTSSFGAFNGGLPAQNCGW